MRNTVVNIRRKTTMPGVNRKMPTTSTATIMDTTISRQMAEQKTATWVTSHAEVPGMTTNGETAPTTCAIRASRKRTKRPRMTSKQEANSTEQNHTIQFNGKSEEIIIADEDWDDDSCASLSGLNESFSMESDNQADQNKPHPSTIFSIPLGPGLSQKVYVAGLVNQCATGTWLISRCITNKLIFIQWSIVLETYLTATWEFQCHEVVTIVGITPHLIMPLKHFTATLKVMDLQHMPYDVLLGQDTFEQSSCTEMSLTCSSHGMILSHQCAHTTDTTKQICMFKTVLIESEKLQTSGNHKQHDSSTSHKAKRHGGETT